MMCAGLYPYCFLAVPDSLLFAFVSVILLDFITFFSGPDLIHFHAISSSPQPNNLPEPIPIGHRSLSATGFWLLCIASAGWLSRSVRPRSHVVRFYISHGFPRGMRGLFRIVLALLFQETIRSEEDTSELQSLTNL